METNLNSLIHQNSDNEMSESVLEQRQRQQRIQNIVEEFEDLTGEREQLHQNDFSFQVVNNVPVMDMAQIQRAPAENNEAADPPYVGIERVYIRFQAHDNSKMRSIREALAAYYSAVDEKRDLREPLDTLIRACKSYTSWNFKLLNGSWGKKRLKEVKKIKAEAEERKSQFIVEKTMNGNKNIHEAAWKLKKSQDTLIQKKIRTVLNQKRLSKQEKDAIRQKKTYKIKKLTRQQQENNERYITGKMQIKSIKNAINEVMPEAYNGMDKMLTDQDTEVRVLDLEHSVGSTYIDMGHDVIEFDVAGSGFDQFRKEHDGYAGLNKQDQRKPENLNDQMLDNKGYLWKNERQKLVQTENGERLCTKTRYTIAGPGMLNANGFSDFSIQATRKRIRDMGVVHLEKIFKKWDMDQQSGKEPQYHMINFMIRGHSRGAVGASQGAMMLKFWLQENYPRYMDYVHFDLIQYDPVPGKDVELLEGGKDEMEKFEVKSYQGVNKGVVSIDGEKMAPLEKSSGTTVVYSMVNQADAKHEMLFSPLEVMHAKRMILMPATHNTSLDQRHIDTSQADGDQTEQAHGMAFIDARTKKVYRGSGLNELDAGVYILDENNVMVKVDSLAQLKNILMRTMPDTFKERRQRILRAAATIFGDRSETDPYSAIDHKRTMKLCENIIGDGNAGDLRRLVQNKLKELMADLQNPVYTKDNTLLLEKYDTVLKSVSDYIARNQGGKWTDAGRIRRDNMKLLFENLTREKRHLSQVMKDQGYIDGKNTCEEILTSETVINPGEEQVDIKAIRDGDNDVYRIDSAGSISFFREMEQTDASAAASISYLTEHMGLQGYYRAASKATIKSAKPGEDNMEGILYEQTYDLSYTQVFDKSSVYSRVSEPKVTEEARKKLDMIYAVDLILGIRERINGDLSSVKVQLQRHQDKHTKRIARSDESLDTLRDTYDIVDVCADHVEAVLFNVNSAPKVGDFERAAVKKLSKEARSFLKNIKASDIPGILSGASDYRHIEFVKNRIESIQKLL